MKWHNHIIMGVIGAGLAACGNGRALDEGPSTGFDSVSGAASPEERAKVVELADAARGVLLSDGFRDNILELRDQYPAVFLRRPNYEAGLNEVVEIISGYELGVGRVPTEIEVVGRADDGSSGAYHAGTARAGVFGNRARIRVGYKIIQQFSSGNIVERSCAINTMAHEISHTISMKSRGFAMAFNDTRAADVGIVGRAPDRSTPVASYLIGSVAQCTYLEKEGRISSDEVGECIEVFGVRSFNDLRCRAFLSDEKIISTPNLPPETPGL